MREAALLGLSVAHLTATAAALLPVRGRERRARVAASAARALLRLWGVRVEVRGGAWPAGRAVYIANHTSALDVFVVAALGLPRTRWFLSGWIRRVPPMAVIGRLTGVFWTPAQDDRAARVACFQAAAAELRRTGESAFLTPEGARVTTGRLGPFNRGAFHLALDLGAPIVPLFIETPPGTDPGMGYAPRPGTVVVHVLPAIDTSGWRLDELERRRDEVRALYLREHAVRRGPGVVASAGGGAA